MAYGTRDGGWKNSIRTFWPDDTDTEMYISTDDDQVTLGKIAALIDQKWPGSTLGDITIAAEFIHTDCLDYDLMDWGDYTNFLCITYNKTKEQA